MFGDIRNISDWRQALIIAGRGYMLQFGTEDAPIASTTSIDDLLVTAVVDVPDGTSAIPLYGQGVVATWTTATLINYMIEVDNTKVRRSSGGSAFTPLALRTDAPIASASTVYVGPDVVTSAKTSGGSLEIYRESIEVNVGDVADYWPKMEYSPLVSPVVVGPASIIVHFGAATADMTVYGNLMWVEYPSQYITNTG